MSAKSKLDESQWRELAVLVLRGMTLKQAQEYASRTWDVQIAYQSIGVNEHIKEALFNRRTQQRLEAGLTLQDTLPSVTKTITDRMADLALEAQEVRKALQVETTAQQYKVYSNRLQAIDSALAHYLKPYREILDWVQQDLPSPTEQKKATKTAQEYLKQLDTMVKEAKKEAN